MKKRPIRRRLMREKCFFCGSKHFDKDLVIIDIDGTICKHVEACCNEGFLNAKPLKKRIELVKHLKKMGHNIIFQTARPESGRDATESWLRKHKIPFDALCMEKSGYAFIIDDRPIFSNWEYVERNVDDKENKIIELLKPIK